MNVIEAHELRASYGPNEVLADTSLSVAEGEVVAVQGRSGSGKSTLLHCLAGLLRPTAGTITFRGTRIDRLRDRDRSRWRLQHVGLVFQFGELVPELTLAENIALPLRYLGTDRAATDARVARAATTLGIDGVVHRRASEASGGQIQRAAIARALVHRPSVVLADEPTGALDSENASMVIDLLIGAARAEGAAVVVVTHDDDVAARCDRTIGIADGVLRDALRSSR